jgi:ABC-2 type transport system permease protein
MRSVFVIADKEFRDHLSSKIFLFIFAILIMVMIFSLWTGIDSYNQQLSDYKSAMSSGSGNALAQLSLSTMLMPSVLQVFQSMVMLLALVGMFLGIALGFGAVSREKDKGSIKFLVSSPIYRDSIIIGKTLGALVTLTIAMGSVFLIAIAIMLFKNVIPGTDDLARIACFFIAALLYCMVFYGISLMMSTITRDTVTALICSFCLIVMLIVFSYMSVQLGTAIAGLVYGPAPSTYSMMSSASSIGNGNNSSMSGINNYMDYISKQYQISDDINIISPYGDFGGTMGMGSGGIGSTLLSKQPTDVSSILSSSSSLLGGSTVKPKDYSLLDSILYVKLQFIALIVELIATFAISYAAFMRMDVR